MTTKNEHLKRTRDEVEDYNQTVHALLAFAALIVHDGESRRPSAEFGFGRRMTTSSTNAVRPSSEVWPDLVAQKSREYGIIAEAKKSLSRDQANWAVYVKQLRKYDDTLIGWWTEDETIVHSDTIMLIHQSRGRAFSRFLQERKAEDRDSVGPTTCLVEFNQSEESVTYYFFRLEFGNIQDEELGKDLEYGVQIPLDKVRESFPSIRYYDARPPLPLLLTHLWTDVFPSMVDKSEYDEATKSFQIPTSITSVTRELQEAFGSGVLYQDSRSVEFPKRKWVREAFEHLLKHKLVVPHPSGSDAYTILYKSFRDDVLKHFINLEAGSGDGKEQEDAEKRRISLDLFPEEEED